MNESTPDPARALVGLQELESGRARCIDHYGTAAVDGEWVLVTTDVDPEKLERVACEVCGRTLAQASAEKQDGQ